MKKFTKWCLVTALTLFLLGIVFCGIFGILGGFVMVGKDGWSSQFSSVGWNGHRWGFRFGNNGISFDFFGDEDWWNSHYDTPKVASISGMEQTSYTASDFTDIDIDLSGLSRLALVVEESADDYIWIKNDSSYKTIKYSVEGGVFRLYGGKSGGSGVFADKSLKGTVYLRLPKGMKLDSIDIEIGDVNMENISLEADTITLAAGAGNFTIDGLTARVISIDVGAGEMEIGSMTAEKVSVSVGAGNLDAENVDVKDIDLEVGMGNISIQGKITGDMDADCAMGNVELELQGAEADHNYELDCAMGNVKIGNREYGGIGSERSYDNGSSSDFDIDCAAGNITIEFED